MSRFYLNIIILICVGMSSVLNAQDIKTLVDSGDRAVEQGNYFGAADFYKRALRISPNIPEVNYKIAEAYRFDNDYQNAAKYYKKLVPNWTEKYPYAEFHLANMLKSRANYLMAQYHFRNFLKKYQSESLDDYYTIRAKREIVACEIAQKLWFYPGSQDIIHFDTTVNSYFAEFAMHGTRDSMLFFTSILPDSLEENNFYARIYSLSIDTESGVRKKSKLPEFINIPYADVANPYYDEKNSCLYYTVSDSLPSRIMKTSWSNGQWTRPEKLSRIVNYPDAVTTHPTIAHTDSASFILYSSNKPGGMGGFDIYYNQIFPDGSFSVPKNWGRREPGNTKFAYLVDTTSRFNTIGNEVSPYYNVSDSTLYFSSDWHYGAGAYDIFKMKATIGDTAKIENMGFPVNSPQNDLYYRIDHSGRLATFTSNRDEALAEKHLSCCNDIFTHEIPEIIIPKTEEEIIQEQITILTKTAEELIPITLYFHNDRPGPASWDTVTDINYEQSFNDYMARETEYIRNFSAGLKGESAYAAQDSIEFFFNEYVNGEFQKLRKFMLLMEELLKKNQNVLVTIKGYTSPLNTPEYNLNLAKRRISSLKNYLTEYKGGSLLTYIDEGLLTIETMPYGDTQVPEGVSDDPNDRRNSVYNPLAARERRIQVIAVKFTNEDN